MNKYIPPTFKEPSFVCPYCKTFSQMDWNILHYDVGESTYKYNPSDMYMCKCHMCKAKSYWLVTSKERIKGDIEAKMIVPRESTAPYPHKDMPDDIKIDYIEASNILEDSPRGASALLRLVIQKLCIHLGEKGNKIDDDIKSLVNKGLPLQIQYALDIVRVVGNKSVHPGDLDNDDVKDVAIQLFELINLIVEDRITRPKEIEALYFKIVPESVRESREKLSLEKENA